MRSEIKMAMLEQVVLELLKVIENLLAANDDMPGPVRTRFQAEIDDIRTIMGILE